MDRGAWQIYSMGLQRVRHDEQLSVGHIYLMKVKVIFAQSCLTLCNPEDCSVPDSSVLGILQQEYWSGFPFSSRGSYRPRDQAQVSYIVGRFFTI